MQSVPSHETLNQRHQRHAPVPMLSNKQSTLTGPWSCFAKLITCCVPSFCLSGCCSIKQPLAQQSWREKVGLCFIVLLLSTFIGFVTLGLQPLLCPKTLIQEETPFNTADHVGVFGIMYQVLSPSQLSTLREESNQFIDVSAAFLRPDSENCKRAVQSAAVQFRFPCENSNTCRSLDELKDSSLYTKKFRANFDWVNKDELNDKMLVYNGTVINMHQYLGVNTEPLPNDSVDAVIRDAIKISSKDGTTRFSRTAELETAAACLVDRFGAGQLDNAPVTCFVYGIIYIFLLIVIITIVLTKFIMAITFSWFISWNLTSKPRSTKQGMLFAPATVPPPPRVPPTSSQYDLSGSDTMNSTASRTIEFRIPNSVDEVHNELYTALLVTCYSEDREGLATTLNSLVETTFPNDRKCFFIIADGIVKGGGNDKTTPEIILEMVEIDPAWGTPKPVSYKSIENGAKQHNMAMVYAGHVVARGGRVPAIIVIKCGTEEEKKAPKPGNRGKRDSQIILMNFFSRSLLNERMSPLDYDMFRKVHWLMGVTPDYFESVLMVDADTKVMSDSLSLLNNAVINDKKIMGLCGETRIANKRQSWVTWIQVFEYYINHHMGKSFESVFGGVTCLPGCFCMYRLKAPGKNPGEWTPILTKPEIVEEYSSNQVDSLHQKNLLLLGEDRFLSTLMMRHFPQRKMMFVPQAVCKTTVPDTFNVLLSQRRRWINSTVHNLLELVLVSQLCGTFCCSMQFIVFMDLIGTAGLPIGTFLFYYMLFSLASAKFSGFVDYIPLLLLLFILITPAILILITTRKIVYVAWMFVYLFALPVWNFILPLYAFWHFDDFSWGLSRQVEGAGKDEHGLGGGVYDEKKVPMRRWEDYERAFRKHTKKRQEQTYDRMQPPNVDNAYDSQQYAGYAPPNQNPYPPSQGRSPNPPAQSRSPNPPYPASYNQQSGAYLRSRTPPYPRQ